MTNLFQHKLVFLLQETDVRVDEVEVVLGSDPVDAAKLAQELLTVVSDRCLYEDNMVNNACSILLGYELVLHKKGE